MNPLLIAADWFGYPPQPGRSFYVVRAKGRWCIDEFMFGPQACLRATDSAAIEVAP